MQAAVPLLSPQFFIARHQGQSPPRLHKARVEVNGIKPVITSKPILYSQTGAAIL